ncbi:2-hydroxyacyl-CoA dehydratase [Chloroflexota bacterium]
MFKQFADIVGDRHQYAKDWKVKTGKKIIGYFCTYVPEELIYAADILPVRVMGGHDPDDLTGAYIPGMYCPFCRDVLSERIRGKYDYIDGVVKARSCFHMRQAFSNWVTYFPSEYWHYIYMPAQVTSSRSHPTLMRWLDLFKRSLEEWTGKAISDEDLKRGIEIMNTNRSLLKRAYELRMSDPPLLSGAEALQMVMSSQYMHKEEHSQLLGNLLEELPDRQDGPEAGRPRLIMIGSCDDYPEVVGLIESSGANVVTDEKCTGSRYFWNNVDLKEDPIADIATRYLQRPPCPQKDFPERRRFTHIMELVKDYDVQGVVFVQQKFCNPHEFDIPVLDNMFKEQNIPTLFLEIDVTVPVGQFRTRVEAFIETMELELL